MTPGHRWHWKILILSEVSLKISQPGGAQCLTHLQCSLITWNSRVYEQMHASTSSGTTCSKQPYSSSIVAGLLHVCNVYNTNEERCLSFQMRYWEKSRYQTNDYREQQKLLLKVEHLQHAKWQQNLSDSPSLLPPNGIRPVFGSWPSQFSSPISAYFVAPTSNFV